MDQYIIQELTDQHFIWELIQIPMGKNSCKGYMYLIFYHNVFESAVFCKIDTS